MTAELATDASQFDIVFENSSKHKVSLFAIGVPPSNKDKISSSDEFVVVIISKIHQLFLHVVGFNYFGRKDLQLSDHFIVTPNIDLHIQCPLQCMA